MTQSSNPGLTAQVPAHVRAILTATQETLGLLFDVEPSFGPARVCSAQMPRENDVNVIVGFTGGVRGQILLGMTRRSACQMASVLMMEELPEWNELTASGMAEIANIVAGGCATSLHQSGIAANITVPSVISGEHVQITWPNLFILETTLTLPQGTLNMAVGVKVAQE